MPDIFNEEPMRHPTQQPCLRTYRWIQAHCAKRVSVRVGQQLRAIAGANGNIAAIPTATLRTQFDGGDLTEALRLVELAIRNSKRTPT